MRPAKRRALNWGWRGQATALKLRLEAKADYALAEDASAFVVVGTTLVATMLAKKREDRPTMEQVATTLRDHAAAASAGGSASHPALQAGQVPRGTSSQPALQAGQIPRGTGSQPSLQLSGDLAALSHPSTLGRIVGQQVEEPQRKGSALSLALGALLLLGSGGLTAWLLRPPRPSPIKRPPAPVRWSITTQPSGATISSPNARSSGAPTHCSTIAPSSSELTLVYATAVPGARAGSTTAPPG